MVWLSLVAAAILFLAGVIPVQAQNLPPMPGIVTNAPLTLRIVMIGPVETGGEYDVHLVVKNHTETTQRFDVIGVHGAQDWDTNSLHFKPVEKGGRITISECLQERQINFCRIDWNASVEPGQELLLNLKAMVPPQTRILFGQGQQSTLLTLAALYHNKTLLSESRSTLRVDRFITTIYI